MARQIPGRVAAELLVDLPAIAANFNALKSLVDTGVEIAAVIKSNAYGLGLETIASTLADAGCASFFVGDLSEGVRVRRQMARAAQIYVLSGCNESDLDEHLAHRLIPVCNRLDQALIASAGLPAFALNLETGFSRFGLRLSEVRAFAHMPHRPPKLVLSHLACAEAARDPTNHLQRNRFVAMCEMLEGSKRSLSASASVWLGPMFHFDLIRAGSAIYGLNTAGVDPNPLSPVLRLVAPIVDVRTVEKHEAIGYGASFRCPCRMRVAIVALGYAGGLPWSTGNVLSVLVGSHRAPVVGRVAMEYVVVDLTGIPEALCRTGTSVEFVGPTLSVEALATAAGTVPQEILVRLGAHLPKRFVGADVIAFAGENDHA